MSNEITSQPIPSIAQTGTTQALARKWRPQTFQEVVGQQHALQALIYSLDHQRLHHAYLLTGTRGVGKTTLGRIFAKALNCEAGISSTPCEVCSTCRDITAGCFVDLIEVDGASNTKVEDTRELLEDVQFVPTHGRFKVYLIDEVHMLSTHSFNALLKTLEEPPDHVKFILATTDPQKLPVTVLSRCLQFHLRLLTVPLIQEQLHKVLDGEGVASETQALYLLAEAARGSMRDALTLADQARSQGMGEIQTQTVIDMLGLMDVHLGLNLLQQIIQGSAQAVFSVLAQVELSGIDYDQVFVELIESSHQVVLVQSLGDAASELIPDQAKFTKLKDLAQSASAEQMQLIYETLITGRKALPFTSSPRTALRMVLLRSLYFQRFTAENVSAATTPAIDQPEISKQQADPVVEKKKPEPYLAPQEPEAMPPQKSDQDLSESLYEALGWHQFVQQHSPGGILGQIIQNSRLVAIDQGNTDDQRNTEYYLSLIVDDQMQAYDLPSMTQRLETLFKAVFNKVCHVNLDVQSSATNELLQASPHILRLQDNQIERASFETEILAHPFVAAAMQLFGDTISLQIAE